MNNPIMNFGKQLKQEFQGYNSKAIQKDIMAGITVAAVSLPLALAFGASSGADAAAGLITAIIAAFIVGGLSGTSYQISGPSGATVVILLPLALHYGMEGIFITGFMAGVILILAGLLKLGKLVYFLPAPVVLGFTSGIALIIALGQVDNFLGVTSEGENAVQKIGYLFKHDFEPNVYAVMIAMLMMLLMIIWPKKWGARLPASLVGLIVITVINMIVEFPVTTVGKIPQTLFHENRIHIADLMAMPWKEFIVPALSLAVLCMIESLLCIVVAGRMKGERINANQELIAQGVGNIVIPFMGGVPVTAAVARTSVGIKSGQITRMTGIVQGIVMLLSMFLFSPFMSKIPLSALAGVLIMTAWRMNVWQSIRYIFGRHFYWSAGQFLVTMIATVVLDLAMAVVLGVIFSIFYFIIRISNIDIEVSEIDAERMGCEVNLSRDVKVMYVTGPIFFGSLDCLMKAIESNMTGTLIISMRGVPLVDTSGVQAIIECYEKNQQAGNQILFASLQKDVKRKFQSAGVLEMAGEKAFFDTAKEAITYLDNHTNTGNKKYGKLET